MDGPRGNVDELAVVFDHLLHEEPGDEAHRLVDHRGQRLELVAERAGFLLRGALAHSEVDPTAGQDVEGGDPLRHLHRVVHLRRQADDPVAEPDAVGAACQVGEEGLGSAHVRVMRERGVLDGPDHVESQLLGEQRLLDDVGEHLPLVGRRRVGHLGLVDQREPHGPTLAAGAGGRRIGRRTDCPAGTPQPLLS